MPHKTLKIWRIWYSREKYIATPNRGQVVWIQNNTLDSDLHDPILIKQECAGIKKARKIPHEVGACEPF